MEQKIKEIRKENGQKVKVMEWPTPEAKDKSWGNAGFDRHHIK